MLFLFPPEMAHVIVENFLYFTPNFLFKNKFNKLTEITLFGKKFPSPIGVAAGLDKNCKSSDKYLNMGFGFSVVGTVMKDPRKGNLKPRLIRLINEKALINSLSFPSDGSEVILKRLKKLKNFKDRIIVSVSGSNEDEIIENISYFNGYCFGFEINISSPNTKDLKKFINPESVNSIISKARNITDAPVLIKLPRIFDLPVHLDELVVYEDILRVVSMYKKSGVVLANTRPINDDRLKVGSGGKSGKPLFDTTLLLLNHLRPKFNIPIICSGGVSNFNDAKKLLESGADAIQVYTALIYEGPGIAKKINKQLKNSRLLN
ncbi:MAG: dihydroorotate dehydrogenase 2 [Chloroflexota bacterium]|nr:dihydroorotate dehydrogenase 2 [Chloroflexota bacterium]|tara:strand:- start:608 stop:1564 length:957 start_codon:yes stop_codon:yes gene_type:complete